MLNTFLSVIDRLISIKKYRGERARRIFEILIQPTYDDLALIHKDYISMFEEVADKILLVSNTMGKEVFISEMKGALIFAKKRRGELEPVRIALRSLTSVSTEINLNENIYNYFEAISNYFPNGLLNAKSQSYSVVMSLEKDLIERALDKMTLRELNIMQNKAVDSLHHLIEEKNEEWGEVCFQYAKIKLEVVSSD